MHKKAHFLLRILTHLPLLCDVVWLSYGYSSGLRSNFKSCKSHYSIKIQKDTRTCITENNYYWFWKLTLSHSVTYLCQSTSHSNGRQNGVKMRRRKLRFHTFISFSHNLTWQYILLVRMQFSCKKSRLLMISVIILLCI